MRGYSNKADNIADKDASEGRLAERTEELARLQTKIVDRERALPLLERIKAMVTGMTVTAIFLAERVMIGAVTGAITNVLKPSSKSLKMF